MESFEIKIKDQSYKIIRLTPDDYTFSVFNYTTCHIIKKNDSGQWEGIKHRFGLEFLPLTEIGNAIDQQITVE